MKVPAPTTPTRTGVHEGRPYELWLPGDDAEPPWPAIVIVHGAGSRKENHADFARAAVAFGWAAVAYDQRGHGASEDEMAPGAVGDVATMARFIAAIDEVDPSRVCVRGSSLGGMLAIHAAAVSDAIAGAIAICPAREEGLLRALRRGDLEIRADEARARSVARRARRRRGGGADRGKAAAADPRPAATIESRTPPPRSCTPAPASRES